MPNEIIWVDDEPLWGERHIEELRRFNWTVYPFDNVDDADTNYDSLTGVNGVVLDINMPWGTLFTEEMTSKGLTTGIKLLGLWRDRLIARKQPVFVLTNRDVDAVEAEIAKLKISALFVKTLHKKGGTSPKLF